MRGDPRRAAQRRRPRFTQPQQNSLPEAAALLGPPVSFKLSRLWVTSHVFTPIFLLLVVPLPLGYGMLCQLYQLLVNLVSCCCSSYESCFPKTGPSSLKEKTSADSTHGRVSDTLARQVFQAEAKIYCSLIKGAITAQPGSHATVMQRCRLQCVAPTASAPGTSRMCRSPAHSPTVHAMPDWVRHVPGSAGRPNLRPHPDHLNSLGRS